MTQKPRRYSGRFGSVMILPVCTVRYLTVRIYLPYGGSLAVGSVFACLCVLGRTTDSLLLSILLPRSSTAILRAPRDAAVIRFFK